MAQVQDVAAYILEKRGPMTAMKLQKLVYYSQAWHLVWEEWPLFEDRIEAWANGPVVPALYGEHRGMYQLLAGAIKGEPYRLEKREMGSIDAVLDFYGDKPARWLSELTHRESPWIRARERAGLEPMERGNAEITLADLDEYYGGLVEPARSDG